MDNARVGTVGRRSLITGVMAAAGATAVGTGLGRPAAAANAAAADSRGTDAFVNVKVYGARGDGTHDDTAMIQRAISAAAGGQTVFFPPGDYVVSGPLHLSAATQLLGSGMWQTTVRRTSIALFVDCPSDAGVGDLDLEGICFDGAGFASNLFEIDGAWVGSLNVRSCRFTNLVQGPINVYSYAAVVIEDVLHSEFTDCLWHNPAQHAGYGIGVMVPNDRGAGRIVFTGANRFLWLCSAMRLLAGGSARTGAGKDSALDFALLDGVYVDSYWYLLPARWQGDGASVSYAANGLTDTSANFSEVPAGAYPNTIYVRAMPVRHTGVVTSSTEQRVSETGVHFGDLELRRGELVRSGNAFAVITRVDTNSDDSIVLEGWLDKDTLLPTTPPPAGASYAVYGLILGQISVKTTNTLTFNTNASAPGAWFDLYGNAPVPEPGTHYEILQTRGAQGVLTESGVRHVRVLGCTFRRSHHDQLGGGAQRWQAIGNVFQDGQDMGMSCNRNGQHQIVDNVFIHQGCAAVYLNGTDCVVTDNRSESPSWRHQRISYGHYQLSGSQNCYVGHNVAVGGDESVHANCGVTLADPSSASPDTVTQGNIVENNVFDNLGASATGVAVYGTMVSDNHIVGTSSVSYYAGGQAQRMTASGDGSPESHIAATPGSLYTRIDGGAGATLYIKETGSGTTGWAAK